MSGCAIYINGTLHWVLWGADRWGNCLLKEVRTMYSFRRTEARQSFPFSYNFEFKYEKEGYLAQFLWKETLTFFDNNRVIRNILAWHSDRFWQLSIYYKHHTLWPSNSFETDNCIGNVVKGGVSVKETAFQWDRGCVCMKEFRYASV